MVRQRNYAWVSEHRSGVSHEQKEDYDIKGNHMKTETKDYFLGSMETVEFDSSPAP